MLHLVRRFGLLLFVCLLPCAITSAKGPKFTAAQIEYFEAKVRPLLVKHCYRCHSDQRKEPRGGLRVDQRGFLLKGGDTGPAIVPGKPEKSLLMKAVRWQGVEMPPNGKLSANEIAILEKWIEQGAAWPDAKAVVTDKPKSYDWEKLRADHWAFRPVQHPPLPKVRMSEWPQNPVDHFVLARLEAAGLEPSPPADARILLRRFYYDLIGLPPTPEETDSFLRTVDQDRQLAITQLVDRLLALPQYGERWGRHWLDVARYSDGFGGFLDNAALPHAWKYRDWVIHALNRDLPYDQFVKQQIAGDLMNNPEAKIAPGFFALGPTYRSDGGDPDSVAQAKSETLDDRIDTLSRGFLALTVSCARCHDHKFDPIPQMDYYSLAGVFNNTRTVQGKNIALHTLADAGSKDMHIALRGNLRKPGEIAPRRFVRILSEDEPKRFTKGSGRLELADAIVHPENPLTARVMVNRIWLHHFGKALVRTPSNFGKLGEAPTHPLLLDWLATHFIQSGWSIKKTHRMILLSATYQMSSHFSEKGFQLDGDNRLVWRYNPRKLDVEAWRDTLLATTGELIDTIGGPPTQNVQSPQRTLYFKVSRNGDRFATDEFLRLFDFPLMRATVAKRPTSIVPQQFHFLMNSEFTLKRAKVLASRLQASADDDPTRIDNAYRILFGRIPTSRERALGLTFLNQKPASEDPKTVANKTGATKDDDILIADFEGETYGDWKTTGDAFGPGPAQGTLGGQMVVTGFMGRGLVNSFYRGDGTTGTLTSPPIPIKRRFIHFLVGGGKYPGATCINLLLNGKVVRTATGPNDRGGGSEKLTWATWDVAEFLNKDVVVQIVDNRKGGWGHINVDHLLQSNRKLDASRLPQQSEKSVTKSDLTPWQQYAQILLSCNELTYLR